MNTKRFILVSTSVLLLTFSAFPLLILIVESFRPAHLSNYLLILSKKTYATALWNTLKLCTFTTLITVVIGLPLAWLLEKTDLPQKKLFKSLFAIPYIIPPYIGAMAWIKLLNPNSGSLNRLLANGLSLAEAPFNIYSMTGAVWVLGLFFYSFILLACVSAFQKMDPALEEAALMCGAGRLRAFKDVTFPLLTPALLGGVILVFVAAGAAFGVPALLMMPVRLFVLTTKIYNDVISLSGGIMRAASLSVI